MHCYPMIQTSFIVESAYYMSFILFESHIALNSKKKTESTPSFSCDFHKTRAGKGINTSWKCALLHIYEPRSFPQPGFLGGERFQIPL